MSAIRRAGPVLALTLALAGPASAAGWERTYTLAFADCPAAARAGFEAELRALPSTIDLRPIACGPTRCRMSHVSTIPPADLAHELRAIVERSGYRARISVEGLRYGVACLPGRRVQPAPAPVARDRDFRPYTPPPFTEYEAPCATIFDLAGSVLFDYASARIRSASVPALTRLAERIRALDPAAVEITGHTDSHGTRAANQDLSVRRARSVARYLSVSSGLRDRRFLVRGMGEDVPVAPNRHADGRDNPEGRQANRRVEVVLRAADPACRAPGG